MDPPWLKHPEVPAGSIGWRMGGGEEYYDQFYRWFSNLSHMTQDDFAQSHLPPFGWEDIYKNIRQNPWR